MKRLLLSILLLATMTAVAGAQIPRTISFQGVLADAGGILLPDGPVTLTLNVYDRLSGGTPLFSETQTVTVTRGVFNAIIGSSGSGIPPTIAFDQPYWLGVQVGSATELAPRTPFTSVPYALNAAVAQVAIRATNADTAAYALRAVTSDTAGTVRGGYVLSLNGQQGAVEILGAGATTVTRSGNQVIIRSTDTSGGGIKRIDNFDGSLVIDPPNGPFVTMFIREGGVQTYHLRDQSVTTPKIADQAVTNAKLGPLSISTDKIQDFAVTNPKIGPNAVTTDKIMDLTILEQDLADNSVTSPKIKDGEVMTVDIANLAVTNAKLGPDAVTTDKIMDGQVMTNDIANLNVTTAKLADLSVTNGKLAPDAVTTDKIMNGQVQTLDIADLNVTNAKLAADAVTTDKIMNGQVQNADIGANAVDAARMNTGGAPNGYALMSTGAATPIWSNPIAYSLPFSASVNSASTLWSLTNTGTGGAGYFAVANATSTSAALTATSSGTAPALAATATGSGMTATFYQQSLTNTTPSVSVINYGNGTGLMASVGGGSGASVLNSPAIYADAGGTRIGVVAVSRDQSAIYGLASGSGTGVTGANLGTGTAGYFAINNTANTMPAVYVQTNGTGQAGYFTVANATTTANAMYVTTNGLGRTGLFNSSNAAYTGNAVEVTTAATSTAAAAIAGIKGTDIGYLGAGSKGVYSPTFGLHAGVFGQSTDIGVQGDGRLGVLGICTQTSGTAAGVFGYARDFGNGARFEIDPVTAGLNTSSAMFAGNYGNGRAINAWISSNTFGTNTNASDVITAITYGTGTAGNFIVSNSANSADGLISTTIGTGRAGNFTNSNTGFVNKPTVEITKAGSGSGFADGALMVSTAGGFGQQTVAPPGGNAIYGVITSTPITSVLSWNPNSAVNGVNLTGSGNAIAGWASTGGFAGYFNGDVQITGNLNVIGSVAKGGGSFKIDHPLDPQNKYLYHSFVESPDMMNIYNGVIVLDGNGEANVTLPDWFQALNRDYRYQLTCIGGFAPVYVSQEVSGNHFSIAGGKPGMKVSWEVTGIRQDAYANAHRIPVEEMKPTEQRGTYLYPDAFGVTTQSNSSTAQSENPAALGVKSPAAVSASNNSAIDEARAGGAGPALKTAVETPKEMPATR